MGVQSASSLIASAGVLMLAGLVLRLAESHAMGTATMSRSTNIAHRHDDGHHDHVHVPMPTGAHSHWHRHEPLWHSHPHVPDAHHITSP